LNEIEVDVDKTLRKGGGMYAERSSLGGGGGKLVHRPGLDRLRKQTEKGFCEERYS